MKLINEIRIVAALGVLAITSPTMSVAQTVLPENDVPVIFAPQKLDVSFNASSIKFDVESNVDFEIVKTDSTAQWASVERMGNGDIFFHVKKNIAMSPRQTSFILSNKDKGLNEMVYLTQEGDMTIYPEDYAILVNNFVQDKFSHLNLRKEEVVMDSVLRCYYKENGSFSDINYSDRHRTKWQPQHHYKRLENMAAMYINPNSKYYKDDAMYDRIIKGLQYFYDVRPWCGNWWFNQIGYTTGISYTMLLMTQGEKKVPKVLQDKFIQRINGDVKSAASFTPGSNKVSVATCVVYVSILTNDEKRIRENMGYIYSSLSFGGTNGIQVDYGFWEGGHGRQFYVTGYGHHCMKDILKIAPLIETTKFAAMTKFQKDLMSEFIRNSYYRCTRGRGCMFATAGRGLVQNHPTNTELAWGMRTLEYPNHKEEYDDIIARINHVQPASYHVKPENKHYFVCDYFIHTRPEFTFDFFSASSRTSQCEEDGVRGNKNNPFGHYASYGSTNIQRTGEEYIYCGRYWDWARVPGTTAPHRYAACRQGVQSGKGNFNGAVSDSLYGAVTFDYFDDWDKVNTGVRRTMFCFDKEVVCLGRVNSTAAEPVMTTLNQTYNNNTQPIYSLGGKETELKLNDSISIKDPEWVYHNGVGYVIPEGGNVFVKSETVHTTLGATDFNLPQTPIQADIFTVGIEHGLQPKESPVAYILVPSVNSSKELAEYVKTNPIEILQNDTIQSVYHKDLKIWQATFFKAKSKMSYKGMTVESDHSCVWMLKEMKDGSFEFHASDPSKSKVDIHFTVTLPGKAPQKLTLPLTGSSNTRYAGLTRGFVLK